MGKPTKKRLEQARTLIENYGDPVLYRGVRWYYLRKMTPWVKRALADLTAARKIGRWSRQTPNVVRFLD